MTRDGALATTQSIINPSSVAIDNVGGFYFSSKGQNQIYHVATNGRLRLVAGAGIAGFSGDGGKAISAQLADPIGIAVDSAGNLFIADAGNDRIRKVTPTGAITTVAGNGKTGFSGDGGPATSAQLNEPMGVAIDAAGNLFIADTANQRIRKVTAGVITTIAGNGIAGAEDESGESKSFGGDGGPAVSAQLYSPQGVAIDSAGNLYIADTENQCIRKVAAGVITTVAGNWKRCAERC
jgi:sugar lactone lactonase YvrE